MTAKQLAGRVGGASPQAGSLACPWRRGAVLKVAGLALLRSVQGAVVAVNRRAARAGSEGATPHASADHAAARTGASSVCGMKMQAKSAAIPYLDAPPALDGSMAGDVGFDPLWVSSALPDAGWIKYLREVSAIGQREYELLDLTLIRYASPSPTLQAMQTSTSESARALLPQTMVSLSPGVTTLN